MEMNAKNVAKRNRAAEAKRVKKAVAKDPDAQDYKRLKRLKAEQVSMDNGNNQGIDGETVRRRKARKVKDLKSQSPKTKKETAKAEDDKTRGEYEDSVATVYNGDYGMEDIDPGNPTEEGFKKYKGKKNLKKSKAKFDAQPKVMAGQKPKAGKVKPLPKKKVRKKTAADRAIAQQERENAVGTFF